tara:strand:+ start:1278 stop:2240 length:963 start_codon:yes stop_codon:yes gene_type:complete
MKILLENIPTYICDKGKESSVIYSDTDSIYVHAYPLLKKLYPDFDKWSDKKKDDKLEIVAILFQEDVTKHYDKVAKDMFRIRDDYEWFDKNDPLHRLDMKTECVIRSAYFRAHRRYAQWITKQEGRSKESLDVKGLEFMKTNFPQIFNDFFYSILKRILEGANQKEIVETVIKFKNDILNGNISIDKLGNPQSVKGIENYMGRTTGTKCFSEVKKRSPAAYRAAIYYNDLLRIWGLEDKYELITNGSKIKWIYLIDNPYGINVLAFSYLKVPKKMLDFINKFADRERIYKTILENKLEGLFSDLGWTLATNKKIFDFFSY